MSTNELKSGDIILVKKRFHWRRGATYLPAIIRFFVKSLCRYNHCAIVVQRSTLTGMMTYVYEAKGAGFIKTKYHKWVKKHQPEDCLYRRPNFKFHPETVEHTAYRIEGTPEDLTDTVFQQIIRQISREMSWIRKMKTRLLRTLYSSEAAMFLLYAASTGAYFVYWYKIDPRDLWKSELFDDIIVK